MRTQVVLRASSAVVASLFFLVACAPSRMSLRAEERVVERSTESRPEWLSHVPVDQDDLIFSVGRARAGSESGALVDAREDAYRQLVDTHYGSTLKKQYERIRTEVGQHIVDRLVSAAEGRVAGARDRQVYWERVEVRRAVDEVEYYHRAYVLVEVDRGRFDRAVDAWISSSPTVVEAKGLEAKATRLVADQIVSGRGALAAAGDGRIPDLARLSARVEEADREIDAAEAKYRSLLGADLPVRRADASALVGQVRRAVADAQRSVLVAIHVQNAPGDRRAAISQGVSSAVSGLGLAAEITKSRTACAPGASHSLTVEVGEPDCRRPGMGVACDLPVEFALYSCPGERLVGRAAVTGPPTRGAAMDKARAVDKAWDTLADGDGLAEELRAFVEQYVPVAPLPARAATGE